MKQLFTKLMLMGLIPLAGYGQTIVSTTPENKKVILEEFTGIHCVYCPQGHVIAEQIMTSNPGNAFAINVHVGGFATPTGSDPDFRTEFGTAIAAQTGLTGYPSGTINRHVFPGMEMGNAGSTALGRGEWTAAANEILTESSYLNVGAEAEINATDRVLTVNVEVYYTGDSPVETNYLNVALIQNNTKGPQTGGNQGSNYNHMHRLVSLVSGQWGEEITTTTAGSLVSKTFTYEVPVFYNNVFADIDEFEIVAFVTESHQEIVSGNGAEVTVIPSDYNNDLHLSQNGSILPICNDDVTASFILFNAGTDAITSSTISYSINGGAEQSYEWTGDLEGNAYEVINIPVSGFDILEENTIVASVVDDENNDNNEASITFGKATEAHSQATLEIKTDNWGNETSWNIKDSAGTTVFNGSGYGNNQTYNIDLTLPLDCYVFTMNDTYGDGGAKATLKNMNGDVVWTILGNSYGNVALENFSTDGTMAVNDIEANLVSVYPNPSDGIINVSSKSQNNTIEVFDITGKKVYSTQANSLLSTIDLSSYGKGVFVIKISDGKTVTTKKVILK